MGSKYNLGIEIDADTLRTLKNEKLSLYCFRAVKSSVEGGLPTVWYKKGYVGLQKQSLIGYELNFGAFIASAEGNISKAGNSITNNVLFNSRSDMPIDLGQTLEVDGNGNPERVAKGVKDTISIHTMAKATRFTCGISEYINEGTKEVFNPMCAFPLLPTYTDLITPIQQIALMFASDTLVTATAVERSLGPGIIVDLTSSPTGRHVTYSIDDEWTADTLGAATKFESNDDMSPLLINPAK